MTVKCVYVFPQVGDPKYFELGIRFLKTYHEFPAGLDHEMLIVCNGGDGISDEAQFVFSSIPNCRFMHHDNSGHDIGAFQRAAKENPCDLMVFFGASTYLKGPNWLFRMADAFTKHGLAQYGVMGNRGVRAAGVEPHIRTTGFWCPPSLMNEYPHRITRAEQRYMFEHQKQCFTTWVKSRRLRSWVVTWDGEYLEPAWDSFPNGFHRGDQSAMLCGDHLSCPPWHPVP
jgi:hypothetical protein